MKFQNPVRKIFPDDTPRQYEMTLKIAQIGCERDRSCDKIFKQISKWPNFISLLNGLLKFYVISNGLGNFKMARFWNGPKIGKNKWAILKFLIRFEITCCHLSENFKMAHFKRERTSGHFEAWSMYILSDGLSLSQPFWAILRPIL